MQDKKAILIPEATYHIYNRANGNELMFVKDENYMYFLKKYDAYISPIADTFCYCLMPNHFHFLVRIKKEEEVESIICKMKGGSQTLQGFETLEGLQRQKVVSKFLSQQFSHLFNAYTQAFNKQQNRKGSLFMHTFKRKQVTKQAYLLQLVHYIHYNPIAAKLTERLEGWKYSSYGAIISDRKTALKKEDIVALFDDLENFIFYHKQEPHVLEI